MERANHRSETHQRTSAIVSVLFLFLLSVTACVSQDMSSPASVHDQNTFPTGSGRDFEPGTGRLPWALPYGQSGTLLAANGLLYAASQSGHLSAFDPASGRLKWQRHLAPQFALYAVDQQAAYAVAQSTLYAVRASDGHPLWQLQAGAPIVQVTLVAGILSLNTIPNGQVALLSAVRASDGRLLWRSRRQTEAAGLLGGTGDGTIYVVDSSGAVGDPRFKQRLHALGAADGQERWSAPLLTRDGTLESVPERVGGIVYVATLLGALYALRADTGALLWHGAPQRTGTDIDALQAPTVRIVQGILYIGAANTILAYRASDGHLLWRYPVLSNLHINLPLAISGGVLYYKEYGQVGALNARSGRFLWLRFLRSSPYRPLIVEQGEVIDAADAYVLRSRDGKTIWQHQEDVADSSMYAGAAAAYAVTDDRLFRSSDDGQIEAFKLSDGSLLWRQHLPILATQTNPLFEATLTFAKTVSYTQALASISNLGLSLAGRCPVGKWRPPLPLQEVERDFSGDHRLAVWANANSAPYWFKHLQTTPGVTQAVATEPSGLCHILWPTGGPEYIPRQQVGALALVGFSAGISYEDALVLTTGLGFRLAGPCYESDRARGLRPNWQPMGQFARYQATHTLQLATTYDNAETWLQQLRAAPTITRVQVTFHLDC